MGSALSGEGGRREGGLCFGLGRIVLRLRPEADVGFGEMVEARRAYQRPHQNLNGEGYFDDQVCERRHSTW